MPEKVLSIVIPAYNEERFIGTLLEQINALDLSRFGVAKELLVVDDGSSDRTAEIAEAAPGVTLKRQIPNQGKGAAVRAGLEMASGDYVLIQDADLEYDPGDYTVMLEALTQDGVDAVYGSRYIRRRGDGAWSHLLGAKHPNQSWSAYLGGRSLSVAALLATGRALSDTVTALKMFERDVIKPLALHTTGFELDHEITSKVLARGYTIVEVPIRYYPRSRAEGKKIGLKDWFRGVRTFARYRNG